MKKYVLIVLDGAGDLARYNGLTPLQLSNIPVTNELTKKGFGGLMETLYDDLPKGSIVAQLGMLGYDPYKYYPGGRASCEGLSVGVEMSKKDVAFRANFSLIDGNVLRSFNANYIKSKKSKPLVEKINKSLSAEFPEFHLYHNSDFRNTLVYKNASIGPEQFLCIEPHENMGKKFDFSNLIKSKSLTNQAKIDRLNGYIMATTKLLEFEEANIIFPWSASSQLSLPRFALPFPGKAAIVGNMDFLKGISIASGIDFFKRGNGNWDTDYISKGKKVIELLESDYSFIYCHINGPDEASHMGDLDKKVYSLERADNDVILPIYEYFKSNVKSLGGIMVTTDHFTNLHAVNLHRIEAHSKDLVPFSVYNGILKDKMLRFNEDDSVNGKYGVKNINHLDLLNVLWGQS